MILPAAVRRLGALVSSMPKASGRRSATAGTAAVSRRSTYEGGALLRPGQMPSCRVAGWPLHAKLTSKIGHASCPPPVQQPPAAPADGRSPLRSGTHSLSHQLGARMSASAERPRLHLSAGFGNPQRPPPGGDSSHRSIAGRASSSPCPIATLGSPPVPPLALSSSKYVEGCRLRPQ